jgi:MFS transporter, DHA1 family, staphyloferrin A biosynthesis exporter
VKVFTAGYTFASLRSRDYRLLWLAQLSTSMGQWMDQMTRGWLMYEITGSALQLGLATALRGLPLLFFGILAGAVADRSNRKSQLIVAQVTNAILNVMLATLVLLHRVQPWHVYVTGFFAGTVQAFQQPARQTLISDIVGARHLMNALALNSMALNVARALGPAAAGLLIAFIGAHGSYYTQAAMFVLATLWTVQMAIPARSPESAAVRREPFLRSIVAGLAFVVQDRDIRTLMILAHGPLTLGMPYMSLMPIFAKDVLHGGARLQGFLLTIIGIGSVLGALGVASMRRHYSYGYAVVVGALAFGITLFGFASARDLVLSSVCAFGVGVCVVAYQTQNQTLLQLLAPREMRGRVMSIFLLNRGLVPLGTFVGGVLAEHLGGPLALQIMSLAVLGVVVLVSLLAPRFPKLRVEFQDRVPTR